MKRRKSEPGGYQRAHVSSLNTIGFMHACNLESLRGIFLFVRFPMERTVDLLGLFFYALLFDDVC